MKAPYIAAQGETFDLYPVLKLTGLHPTISDQNNCNLYDHSKFGQHTSDQFASMSEDKL